MIENGHGPCAIKFSPPYFDERKGIEISQMPRFTIRSTTDSEKGRSLVALADSII